MYEGLKRLTPLSRRSTLSRQVTAVLTAERRGAWRQRDEEEGEKRGRVSASVPSLIFLLSALPVHSDPQIIISMRCVVAICLLGAATAFNALNTPQLNR